MTFNRRSANITQGIGGINGPLRMIQQSDQHCYVFLRDSIVCILHFDFILITFIVFKTHKIIRWVVIFQVWQNYIPHIQLARDHVGDQTCAVFAN